MAKFAADWERFGRSNPYFGVIADADFRGHDLSPDARERFFAGGDHDIQRTLAVARALHGIEVPLGRVLDFGCGVGRTTIPLARSAGEVVGVDISEAMLTEAGRNCVHAGVDNVQFMRSRPGLDGVVGPFDFIHSYIVLQHIPPDEGMALVSALLARLAPAGVAALHLTFGRRASRLRRLASWSRRTIPFVHAALNLVRGKSATEPLMAMFDYDLPQVLALIDRAGFPRPVGVFTDHGGFVGVMLFIGRGRSS